MNDNEKMIVELKKAGEFLIKNANDIIGESKRINKTCINIVIEPNQTVNIDIDNNYHKTYYIVSKDNIYLD